MCAPAHHHKPSQASLQLHGFPIWSQMELPREPFAEYYVDLFRFTTRSELKIDTSHVLQNCFIESLVSKVGSLHPKFIHLTMLLTCLQGYT